MVITDPISDMLARMRNAIERKRPTVLVPVSKLRVAFAEILEKEGLIKSIVRKGKKTLKYIELEIAYSEKGALLHGMKRISKPSRRIYTGVDQLRKVREGYGMSILSTPKGLMTDKDARKQRVGGEVLCEIW